MAAAAALTLRRAAWHNGLRALRRGFAQPRTGSLLFPRPLVVLFACLLAAAALAAEDGPRPAPERGGETGLPVPRFVSLASDKVNVRTGPGVRYPIAWQFVRRGLPVEVVAEFEYWRRIRDQDCAEGWVHKSLLSGQRAALVTGGMRSLLAKPEPTAEPAAQLEPGVRVRLLACRDAWCRVDAGGVRGFLPRAQLWGVYPDEIIQ